MTSPLRRFAAPLAAAFGLCLAASRPPSARADDSDDWLDDDELDDDPTATHRGRLPDDAFDSLESLEKAMSCPAFCSAS